MTVASGVMITTADQQQDSHLRCIEWHFPRAHADDNLQPGFARSDGESQLLYFSSDYLLCLNTDGTRPAEVPDSALDIDVTGKWCRYQLGPDSDNPILLAAANTDRVLANRSCAALTVLDCPAVLFRTADSIEILVLASYSGSFRQAVNAIAFQHGGPELQDAELTN